MTNQKKLQIFISSTFVDLKDERQAAVEAILKAGHIPAGMELFTASNKSQWDIIKRWIDESDIYMLILGGRYGSIESESQKSYTHLEYEYAQSIDKPLFAVVIEESALGSRKADDIEKDNLGKLSEFRKIVLSYMSSFFTDKKDIKLAVHESLGQIDKEYDLDGWIRGNNQSSNFANEMLVVNNEMRKLREENERLKSMQVERLPDIEILINHTAKIEFEYHLNQTQFYVAREPIREIPKHLERYLESEKIDDFNELLSIVDEEAIQNYNEAKAKKFALLDLQKKLDIELSNIGKCKAHSIYVSIEFPNFVKVLESENEAKKLALVQEELASKVIPHATYNPLTSAEREYTRSLHQEKTSLPTLSLTERMLLTNNSNIGHINHINNFPPIMPNVRSFDKENHISLEDNIITIRLSNLLHGLTKVYDDFLLVPFKKGNGTIEVRVHCEEYPESKIIEIPITVN